ncbi:MAG TPA: N,N-dimethylformamidase beta subunit family domain-containing protein, partial [Verrucomicrobiae bacterium]
MNTPTFSRRRWLQTCLGAGTMVAFGGCLSSRSGWSARKRTAACPDLVLRENSRPGTRDWLLQKTRVDPDTKYRCPSIEGYCSHTSIRAGETLAFYVSTHPPSPFSMDIYRLGYYGGAGGRFMTRLGPFERTVQPDPPIGRKRLRDCQWGPCASLTIPGDWVSGVYVGKLTRERGGWQSYVIFIVRDDRRADFLFQCSDTTWQAYNRWPSQFALYDDGRTVWYWGNDVAVSFNRPYGKYCQILDAPLSTGSGEFFLWEFPLAFWLEAAGYDVTYISNLDTHANPRGLFRARGFLSVGHDEYYSIEMFNHLKQAIAAGLNAAFLSGNTCCGRIEFQPDFRGRPRTYERVDFYGPRDPKAIGGMETLPHRSPNSAELVGARNLGPFSGGADWVCVRPEHWLFAGTGMKQRDGIPGLVGWEWHGDPAKISGLEVVASGP